MLNIYKGNTYGKCAIEVYECLRKRLLAEDGKHIIIVPDRFTMQIERGILDYLGIVGSYNIEVLSFARLAEKLLGSRIKKCITPEGAVMLMRKVINDNKEELISYGKALTNEGLASEMFAVLSSIRNSGISTSDLATLIPKLPIKKQGNCKDILLIYKKYTELLQEKFTDATSRLEALADFIPQCEELAATHIYITDFDSFTTKQLTVIRAMLDTCLSVSLGVVTVGGAGNSRVFPLNTLASLREMAHGLGTEMKEYTVIEQLTEEKQGILKHLFSYSQQKGLKSDYIKIIAAEDIEEEISFVASTICNLIREQGFRYRDIALVTGEVKDYSAIIQRVFEKFEIPYFLDDRKELVEEPIVKYVLSAIDVIGTNYNKESVFRFIANPFFAIDNDERDCFITYCEKYAINYSRFCSSFALGSEQERQLPEQVRQKMKNILSAMKSDVISVEQHIENVRCMLRAGNADAIQLQLAEKQKQGYPLFYARSRQTPHKLNALFDTMLEVLPNDEISLADFAVILKTGATHNKIAMIPQFLDSVFVGEIAENRYSEIKALFIIGATEGRIPEERGDFGILKQSDAELWSKQSLFLSPTVRDRARTVRFNLLQLLLKPQTVYVSYPKNVHGSTRMASVLFRELQNIFGLSFIEPSQEKLPYTSRVAFLTLANDIRRYKDFELDNSSVDYLDNLFYSLDDSQRERLLTFIEEQGIEPIKNAKNLFFTKEHTSISQLEAYFHCPYRHFIKYGLKAKDKEKGVLEANIYGNFVHAVLEKCLADAQLFSLKDNNFVQGVKAIINEVLTLEEYQILKNLKAYQVQTMLDDALDFVLGLKEVLSYSEFKPYRLEVGFGFGDQGFKAIKLDGGVTLCGKIDRIDKSGQDVLVIDYKTGEVAADFKYVYYGTKIQLLIYCYALNSSFKAKGAFYLKLSNAYNKSNNGFTYSGVMIDEHDLATRIDNRIDEDGRVPSLNFKYLKKGGIQTNKKGVIPIEEQVFTDMMNYSVKLANKAVEEMKAGNIASSPIEGQCKYCGLTNVCLNYAREQREYGLVQEQSFALEVEDGDLE